MKRLTLYTVGLFLIAGVLRVGQALKTKENTNFAECDEDSYLITPPECPNPAGEILYFPFPYKCYQFFQCIDYEAVCLRCPPGTIWDQDYLNCAPGSETNCTIVTTRAPTTTTATEDPINWVCPEGYDGPIRHPYDCRLFYYCDSVMRPCLFECPDNLYFNPITEWCEYPIEVPDCEGGSPPPPSTTPRAPGLPEGKSLNYRNVNRQNIAETIRYLSKWHKKGASLEQDPCETIKTYIF